MLNIVSVLCLGWESATNILKVIFLLVIICKLAFEAFLNQQTVHTVNYGSILLRIIIRNSFRPCLVGFILCFSIMLCFDVYFALFLVVECNLCCFQNIALGYFEQCLF